jgi:hypothetical protein
VVRRPESLAVERLENAAILGEGEAGLERPMRPRRVRTEPRFISRVSVGEPRTDLALRSSAVVVDEQVWTATGPVVVHGFTNSDSSALIISIVLSLSQVSSLDASAISAAAS